MQKVRHTWQELVDLYPGQWVVLDEVEKDGATVLGGILVNVCTDSEIDAYFLQTLQEGHRYTKRRTTEMGGMGVLYGEDYDFVVSK